MAEPTVTRAALRRAVGRQMGMRFYRYGGVQEISSQSGDRIESDFLNQRDDFWNRSWFYVVDGSAADDNRMIVDSRMADKSIQLEFPPSAGMSAADDYEILDFYSAQMVHEAINEAMRNAWPEFFETKEDLTLCVARDRMEYDISSLGAFMVMQVWIERPTSLGSYNTLTGTTTTVILDTSEDISGYASGNWWITLYDAEDGAGRGYARAISAVNNTTKEITWTDALPSASTNGKAMIYNVDDKDIDWYPAHACDFDNKQWPDKMRFKAPYDNQFAGYRIMIRYITVPAELTAETDVTAVPIDFVISRARAALYDWHKDDTRQDRQRFDGNFTDQMIKSEAIKSSKAFQAPDQLFWTEDDDAIGYSDVLGDPLDWSNF